MNQILFLDFDGVTHPEGCRTADLFCRLPLIEDVLLRHPSVLMVISSSWRAFRPLEKLRQRFRLDLRDRVVGCTPLASQDPCGPALHHVREIECMTWLQTHLPDAQWIALDDNSLLFQKGCPNLLAIDGRLGFTATDAIRLDARLQPMHPVMQQGGQSNSATALMHNRRTKQMNKSALAQEGMYEALRRIWFLGDVHGSLEHITRALQRLQPMQPVLQQEPSWLVFLGDIEPPGVTFREALAPLHEAFPSMRVAFIHGNHDADTHEAWAALHDAVDAVHLHGRVVDLDGVRVAGLGGNFLGRVWYPPQEPKIRSRHEATYRHPNLVKRGQPHAPALNGAIYPDELEALAALRADVLVTHEAPSCHHHGWSVLDQLARDLGVAWVFHGHTHDDLTAQYALQREALGFEAVAVNFRCIKNGLGELVFDYLNEGSA